MSLLLPHFSKVSCIMEWLSTSPTNSLYVQDYEPPQYTTLPDESQNEAPIIAESYMTPEVERSIAATRYSDLLRQIDSTTDEPSEVATSEEQASTKRSNPSKQQPERSQQENKHCETYLKQVKEYKRVNEFRLVQWAGCHFKNSKFVRFPQLVTEAQSIKLPLPQSEKNLFSSLLHSQIQAFLAYALSHAGDEKYKPELKKMRTEIGVVLKSNVLDTRYHQQLINALSEILVAYDRLDSSRENADAHERAAQVLGSRIQVIKGIINNPYLYACFSTPQAYAFGHVCRFLDAVILNRDFDTQKNAYANAFGGVKNFPIANEKEGYRQRVLRSINDGVASSEIVTEDWVRECIKCAGKCLGISQDLQDRELEGLLQRLTQQQADQARRQLDQQLLAQQARTLQSTLMPSSHFSGQLEAISSESDEALTSGMFEMSGDPEDSLTLAGLTLDSLTLDQILAPRVGGRVQVSSDSEQQDGTPQRAATDSREKVDMSNSQPQVKDPLSELQERFERLKRDDSRESLSSLEDRVTPQPDLMQFSEGGSETKESEPQETFKNSSGTLLAKEEAMRVPLPSEVTSTEEIEVSVPDAYVILEGNVLPKRHFDLDETISGQPGVKKVMAFDLPSVSTSLESSTGTSKADQTNRPNIIQKTSHPVIPVAYRKDIFVHPVTAETVGEHKDPVFDEDHERLQRYIEHRNVFVKGVKPNPNEGRVAKEALPVVTATTRQSAAFHSFEIKQPNKQWVTLENARATETAVLSDAPVEVLPEATTLQTKHQTRKDNFKADQQTFQKDGKAGNEASVSAPPPQN